MKEPKLNFFELTPTLWAESIIKIIKGFEIRDTTMGWSLIDLEHWLPRNLPDGELFLDRISQTGWEWAALNQLTEKKQIGSMTIRILKSNVETVLVDLLLYFISNCTIHELIHLIGHIQSEPVTYMLSAKLLGWHMKPIKNRSDKNGRN